MEGQLRDEQPGIRKKKKRAGWNEGKCCTVVQAKRRGRKKGKGGTSLAGGTRPRRGAAEGSQ